MEKKMKIFLMADPALLAMQQAGQHVHVSHVRRCRADRVHNARLRIHPDGPPECIAETSIEQFSHRRGNGWATRP